MYPLYQPPATKSRRIYIINPKNITFPITGDTLAALQQKEVGRELTPKEREFFAEVADMANQAYSAATTGGDIRPALGLMEAVRSVDTQDDYDRHLAGLCLGWILAAANAGVDHYHAQKQPAKGEKLWN